MALYEDLPKPAAKLNDMEQAAWHFGIDELLDRVFFEREPARDDHQAAHRKRRRDEATTAEPEARAHAARKRIDDLTVAVLRLERLLESDKKLPRAAPLLQQLVVEHLDADTAETFFRVLARITLPAERPTLPDFRHAFSQLIMAVLDKRSALPAAWHPQLDEWELQCVVHNALFSDDSFEFNRACRAVSSAVGDLPRAPRDGHERDGRIMRIVLRCLETVLARHTLPWTRAPAKTLFAAAAAARTRFPADLRERLDDLTTEHHRRQTQPQDRAASAWTAQDARELTHPLRRKVGGPV